MKEYQCPHSRRDFLKISAAGAAGVAVTGLAAGKAVAASSGKAGVSAWYDGMEINPNILNTRAVFCYDPAAGNNMIPGDWDMEGQNEAVDKDAVYANLDKMAVALAQTATAEEAWAVIFQQPKAANEWRLKCQQNM